MSPKHQDGQLIDFGMARTSADVKLNLRYIRAIASIRSDSTPTQPLEQKMRPDNPNRYKESFVRAICSNLKVSRDEALDALARNNGDLVSSTLSLRCAFSALYRGKQCSICLEILVGWNGKMCHLKCGHFFHHECIEVWLGISRTCPICSAATGVCHAGADE